MVFPVVGGTQDTAAYEISNSLRFNDDDNPSLSKANSSGGSNTAGTLSFWTKRSEIDTGYLFYARSDDSNVFNVYFSGNERLEVRSTQGGSAEMSYKTNALFRDPSAWYHIVIAVDTTDGTAADRCKLFVNGSRVTSFETQTNFDQNDTIELFQSDATVYVTGEFEGGTIGNPYDGYIADLNFVDGTQYDASSFGETNDNGVWIPKKFTGSQGTNGFRLEFKQTGTSANSSGIGADTSGNDNHLTPSNLAAADITIDTPTNNFCTLNPLHKSTSDVVLSEGNLKMVSGYSSGWQHCAATMAVRNGKWYWEAKALAVAATDKTSIGVFQFDTTDVDFIGVTNTDRSSKGISGHGAGTGSYSYAQGDIIMCGMDLDNNKVYWGKNGTWFGNLDPAAGSGSTTQTIDNSNFCVPAVGGYDDSSWELNFGVPQFSISSGNEDDAGYGNFEYDVPSGFYALCTKNLAEYG
jgi:hypothetical protein